MAMTHPGRLSSRSSAPTRHSIYPLESPAHPAALAAVFAAAALFWVLAVALVVRAI